MAKSHLYPKGWRAKKQAIISPTGYIVQTVYVRVKYMGQQKLWHVTYF